MTPKEKAIELVDKFNKPDTTHYPYVHNAQQCALIAVDEMIAELAYIRTHNEEIDELIDYEIDQRQDFLIEVEKQIKSL